MLNRVPTVMLSIMKNILNVTLVAISKYQNTKLFAKCYTPNSSENVSVIKKVGKVLYVLLNTICY